MNYKSNKNVVYSCKYHVVWCPKYRRKVLVDEISERLEELIVQRCSEISAEIIEMEIMPDHVHLLIEVDPQFGINQAVRSIKQPTLSHHMKILCDCGLVTGRKEGKWIYDSLNNEPIQSFKKFLEAITTARQDCICYDSISCC